MTRIYCNTISFIASTYPDPWTTQLIATSIQAGCAVIYNCPNNLLEIHTSTATDPEGTTALRRSERASQLSCRSSFVTCLIGSCFKWTSHISLPSNHRRDVRQRIPCLYTLPLFCPGRNLEELMIWQTFRRPQMGPTFSAPKLQRVTSIYHSHQPSLYGHNNLVSVQNNCLQCALYRPVAFEELHVRWKYRGGHIVVREVSSGVRIVHSGLRLSQQTSCYKI